MDRRQWLTRVGLSAGAANLTLVAAKARQVLAQDSNPAADRNLPSLKITDIKTILTAPAGIRLVVVKVMTSEPGLYGLARTR